MLAGPPSSLIGSFAQQRWRPNQQVASHLSHPPYLRPQEVPQSNVGDWSTLISAKDLLRGTKLIEAT